MANAFSGKIDAKALARALGCSLAWVRKTTQRKQLPHYQLGRGVRYDLDEVLAHLKREVRNGR
ncbi:MAG: helix-turn-helix domain-containing protein [Deltaproteobacteria bacterium]|nr:helix-turn-helix domain-containing protein [Deltaproteobacteria bacterium]